MHKFLGGPVSLAARLVCTNVPNVWYSLLDGAPDDGLVIVRNM